MSGFNGSGTFNISGVGLPYVSGTTISSSVANQLNIDLANGLTNCITKDGQQSIQANIPFNNYKITQLGAATAATDAASVTNIQNATGTFLSVTGTNTIVATATPAITGYVAGMTFRFVAAGTNVGPVTINISGLGAKAITKEDSQPLEDGDINSGYLVSVTYDGTNFVLQSGIGGGSGLIEQETQTATSGQTVFTLTGITYTPGANNLCVFVDGVKQYVGSSYTETSNTTITFSSGLHLGASVQFIVFNTVEINTMSAASVTYTPSGTGAVTTNVQAKLRETVSVKDFGAVGDGTNDDTAAMQAAHNTNKLVFYPKGTYKFSTITIGSGGIQGEGKQTILTSTDTTSANLITYTGTDPSGLLVNTDGGLFQDFTLRCATATQKSSGAGIYVYNATENYLTIISGIYVVNVPTSVQFSIGSFFTVENSYFSFYSVAGVYAVIDSATYQDNGDNHIVNNWFSTNSTVGPSSRGIWYRCGGGAIIGNKINGGMIGIDINPKRGTSIAIVEGNSVENSTLNAIRGYIGSDFVATGANDGFSFVQIVGNQIGGYNLTGPAISLNSYAADPKFYNCTVSDNLIYNPVNYGARAIDIRQVNRFLVSNNFVDNATVGYGSLFTDSTATSGLVTRNQFLRAAVDNVLNSSTTTTMDQIVAEYSTTYDPPSISAGNTLTLAVTVTGAALGNYVAASFSGSLSGITLTAYVSAANTVTFAFFNGTASAIDLASGTIRARVITH